MKKIWLFFACSTACFLVPVFGQGESPATGDAGSHADRIVFLFLRMKDGAVTLEKAQVVKGAAKVPKTEEEKPGGIRYEALSDDGRKLRAGSIEDPSMRRLEYEDPAEPGKLRVKVVTEKDVTFVVRMPWDDAVKRVRFFRNGAQARKVGESPAVSAPEELGTVEISGVAGLH